MPPATTATGRPLPPPGKTLPKNRPAPLSCRAARQLAAPSPHVTSELQCYISAPASTLHSSRVYSGRAVRRATQHDLKINRKPRRLESAISHRKQTLGTRSGRQFLRVSANRQSRIAAAHLPPHNVSNRQWQILENDVNLSKQTIAPCSNRHKNAVIKHPKCHHSLAATWIFWNWQIDFADWAI